MAATVPRTHRFAAYEAAPFIPFGTAERRGPQPLDDESMADFIATVQALPWMTSKQLDEALVERFVRLGWLRRDGAFIGLTEEGARRYGAAGAGG